MKPLSTPSDADTKRLDWLESQATFGLRWGARPSTTGRGYRLHQDPHPEVGQHKTARAAIDAAMSAATEDGTK